MELFISGCAGSGTVLVLRFVLGRMAELVPSRRKNQVEWPQSRLLVATGGKVEDNTAFPGM